MSMTPEERFDRIEQKLEFVAENQAQLWADIQEHSIQIERISQQIERHSAQIAELGDFILRLGRIVDEQGRRIEWKRGNGLRSFAGPTSASTLSSSATSATAARTDWTRGFLESSHPGGCFFDPPYNPPRLEDTKKREASLTRSARHWRTHACLRLVPRQLAGARHQVACSSRWWLR
jgi:hypothetical protein